MLIDTIDLYNFPGIEKIKRRKRNFYFPCKLIVHKEWFAFFLNPKMRIF